MEFGKIIKITTEVKSRSILFYINNMQKKNRKERNHQTKNKTNVKSLNVEEKPTYLIQ